MRDLKPLLLCLCLAPTLPAAASIGGLETVEEGDLSDPEATAEGTFGQSEGETFESFPDGGGSFGDDETLLGTSDVMFDGEVLDDALVQELVDAQGATLLYWDYCRFGVAGSVGVASDDCVQITVGSELQYNRNLIFNDECLGDQPHCFAGYAIGMRAHSQIEFDTTGGTVTESYYTLTSEDGGHRAHALDAWSVIELRDDGDGWYQETTVYDDDGTITFYELAGPVLYSDYGDGTSDCEQLAEAAYDAVMLAGRIDYGLGESLQAIACTVSHFEFDLDWVVDFRTDGLTDLSEVACDALTEATTEWWELVHEAADMVYEDVYNDCTGSSGGSSETESDAPDSEDADGEETDEETEPGDGEGDDEEIEEGAGSE